MKNLLLKKISTLIGQICLVAILSVIAWETSSGIVNCPYIEGIASWYAEFSPGIQKTTANMEVFDHNGLTCAIWDVPFNTRLEVTNLENGESVVVRVNDRGPAKRLCRAGRIVDLSLAAFRAIADPDKGLIRVRVRVLTG